VQQSREEEFAVKKFSGANILSYGVGYAGACYEYEYFLLFSFLGKTTSSNRESTSSYYLLGLINKDVAHHNPRIARYPGAPPPTRVFVKRFPVT
jgi:hypothetical protein